VRLDFFGIMTSTVLCHLRGEYPVLRRMRVKIQSMGLDICHGLTL
jgi:hypothetical protein